MSLDNTALRLASSPFRVSEFLRKNSLHIAQKTIRDEIIKVGQSLGMTHKQLSKLTITLDGSDIIVHFKYHGPTRGNQARQKWFVEPKTAKALHWSKNNSDFFSKGHFVTGVDGRYVITLGVKRGLNKFKNQLKLETESFLEANQIG